MKREGRNKTLCHVILYWLYLGKNACKRVSLLVSFVSWKSLKSTYSLYKILCTIYICIDFDKDIIVFDVITNGDVSRADGQTLLDRSPYPICRIKFTSLHVLTVLQIRLNYQCTYS